MINKEKIHKAVALLYNKEIHNAPIVISKGDKYLAKRMVEVANKYKVPIVSNEDAANNLMKLDIGDEIPHSLYEAVSIILKYIYILKESK